MAIRDALLPEFDHEMANTRKTLERVPDENFGWKPHEKSMTCKQLANHLAQLPEWATITINEDSFDLAPKDGAPPPRELGHSRDEVLRIFDDKVATARAALENVADDRLMKPWSLLNGGNPIMTMPRIAVLRSFVLSHTIHHRAQLGVYLRLNDIPVPSIYGPSADEGGM
jgi:uncharacterized damage-inducible protein DinB